MDVKRFQKIVEESGLREKHIYERLGISRQAWYNKKNGLSDFTTKEIKILCEVLRITSLKTRDEIFFSEL